VNSKGLSLVFKEHGKNSALIGGRPLSDKHDGIFAGPMIARTVSLSIVAKDFDMARASLDAILGAAQRICGRVERRHASGCDAHASGVLANPCAPPRRRSC